MGEMCEWTGPITETVVVEYMPECHRDSHTAARNSGSWPYNGSVRVAVHHECADRVIESEGDWAWRVDTDPEKYAVESVDAAKVTAIRNALTEAIDQFTDAANEFCGEDWGVSIDDIERGEIDTRVPSPWREAAVALHSCFLDLASRYPE